MDQTINTERSNALRAAIAGALLINTAIAQGSGFALLEQSASRLGTAFAGSGAIADDSTTIFFNPAGLVNLDAAEALAVASAIEITSEFVNRGSLPALGQPLGNDGGDAGDWNFVPSAYASVPLNEDLRLGIGVNAPFGLKLEYDAGWMGRFQALNSEIKTINVNPTVAYRVNDFIAIGLGANYQTIQAELTNAVSYTAAIAQGLQQLAAAGQIPSAAVPGLIAANAGLEGHARVRGDDHAWGYNVGVLFTPTEGTRIGVAYRSSIEYRIEGSARFDAPTVTSPIGAAIVGIASSPGGPLASTAATVDLELPDIATLSASQRFGAFELLADVAWTGWSSVEELRVVRENGTTLSVTPEEWEDTWRFALGGVYTLNDSWTLRAGVAFDESAVPDATRTPRLPDSDRTWLALGAQFRINEMLDIGVGYAHLFSDDASLNQNAGNTNAYGLLVGQYEADVDIVSAQVGVRF
jgi:long-chain fatty acid transport protein